MIKIVFYFFGLHSTILANFLFIFLAFLLCASNKNIEHIGEKKFNILGCIGWPMCLMLNVASRLHYFLYGWETKI
jgi:hypothetical protein